MPNLITSVMYLSAFLVLAELVARFTKTPKIIVRKVVHVGLCLLMIWLSYQYGYHIMISVGLFYVLIFLILRVFPKLQSVRDKEDGSWGELLFPVGIIITAFVAIDQKSFTVALLVLAIADTMAFAIGRGLEKWSPIIIAGRTVAGSSASFITTLIILVWAGYELWFSIQVTMAVSVMEVFSRNGLDNVTMPVTTALMIRYLTQV